METVSLRQLLEEASANHEAENYSGHIHDLVKAFTPENFALLDREHSGVFALLAFDYATDTPVAEYLDDQLLADDSGITTMVFYLSESHPRQAAGRQAVVPGMELDRSQHPAREALRLLFASTAQPAMPGIVFVPRLSQAGESIYVHLSGIGDKGAVRDRLQSCFTLAEQAYLAAGHKGFDARFGTDLRRRQIPFERTGRASFPELLLRVYRFAIERQSDIFAAVSAFGGLLK